MSQLYSHFMKRWILFLLNRHNLVGMDIYDEFIESLTYEVISKMKVYNGIKMFIYLCLLGMLGALWVMCRCLCWTLICLCLRFPSPQFQPRLRAHLARCSVPVATWMSPRLPGRRLARREGLPGCPPAPLHHWVSQPAPLSLSALQ